MHDRDDPWKVLQQELGLVPTEEQAPTPPAARKSIAKVVPALEPAIEEPLPPARQPESEEDLVPMFASGLVAESPVPPAELMAPDDNPVEMGEAPEEVPDEPTPADDGKRRRRRRRRRGRKSDDVPSSNAATDLAPAATPDAAELDDGDDDDDDTTDLDDDEDVEPITFTDWNVPTWQELIGSLYRPER